MLVMFPILKEKKYILLMFQNITQIMKTCYYFNDSKCREMALSYKKKKSLLSIIKRNNV